MGDHEAHKLPATNPKDAFFRIEARVILVNLSEHLFQVYHVLGHAVRLDDQVVHVNLKISSSLLFEDSVYEPLVHGPFIFQSEGHDPVAKIDVFSDEGYFFLSGGCTLI